MSKRKLSLFADNIKNELSRQGSDKNWTTS